MTEFFADVSSGVMVFFQRFDLARYNSGSYDIGVPLGDKEDAVAAEQGLTVLVDLQKGSQPTEFANGICYRDVKCHGHYGVRSCQNLIAPM